MNCYDTSSCRAPIQLHRKGDKLIQEVIGIAYFANFVAKAVRGE